MPKSTSRVWRKFTRDERGNIIILFGVLLVPLVLLLGGSADLARFTRYKSQLSNAVDAASLALARRGEDMSESEATTFVNTYLGAFKLEGSEFKITGLDVKKTDKGFRVSADGAMHTIFLPLGALTGDGRSISSMKMDIVSEVVHSSNRVELALVLDNTGSMNCADVVSSSCTGRWSNPASNSRIVALKSAASKLLDTLMTDSAVRDGLVKVGVVPFEGAVNIKNSSLDYSWLDWNDVGRASANGANFDNYDIDTSNDSCSRRSCSETAERVGNKWLFDQLRKNDSNVDWAGCVEMRAAPYDQNVAAPTASNPDTLFVPFFWPDEPDSDNDNGDSYSNDYLDDITSANGSGAQRYTQKYLSTKVKWHSGKKDTTLPYESGPNYGCPRPLLPLTDSKSSVKAAIDDMIAYPAMGTFIPTGLAWGWRVLSPQPPFTQGIAPGDEHYSQTVKALVLLTDGENSVTAANNHNKSIFSAYNYTGTSVDGAYRLGSSNASAAEANLNTKTSTLCQNVKNAGIRLYTITFGSIPSAAATLMRNCASVDKGESLYYHAPSNADLQNIFASIGQDLSEIHLSM